MYYFIVCFSFFALVNGNLQNKSITNNQQQVSNGSSRGVLTITLTGVGDTELSSTEDLDEDDEDDVINDLQLEISRLKQQLSHGSSYSNSSRECLVESTLSEGESYPIGVDYRRLCYPSTLSTPKEDKTIYPKSCREILQKGNNVSGVYKIKPANLEKPLLVLCDMETRGGGWTHIQKRYDGSVDFFRGWRDYKFGFGDLASEFWLGLENIHKLTGLVETELLVEIVNRDNGVGHAHYKNFVVGAEPGGYTLNTAKGYSGSAGDSLLKHVGQKFSTKDLDQDAAQKTNCALTRGAWWYKACYASNLNSKYINIALPDHLKFGGLQWETFGPKNYCHAKSRMLIRPVE